jgi:hypothetical protein
MDDEEREQYYRDASALTALQLAKDALDAALGHLASDSREERHVLKAFKHVHKAHRAVEWRVLSEHEKGA